MISERLVSIVLPVYNGSYYLDQAVESCLSQLYSNWELIIVDDASTDDTPVRIAQYVTMDNRIRSMRHQTNRQLPTALNTGFSMAKGDYFTWTSDDNCYRPQALAEMVNFLESNPNVDVVYTDYIEIDDEGRPLRYMPAERPERLLEVNCVGPCFLYRRALQEKLVGYDEDLFLVEDYDFWLRALASFRLEPLHKDLYLYRCHSSSLTHLHNERIGLLADKALAKNLPQMYWISNRLRAHTYLQMAQRSLDRPDSMTSYSYLFYAMSCSPMFVIQQMLQGPLGVLRNKATELISRRLGRLQ